MCAAGRTRSCDRLARCRSSPGGKFRDAICIIRSGPGPITVLGRPGSRIAVPSAGSVVRHPGKVRLLKKRAMGEAPRAGGFRGLHPDPAVPGVKEWVVLPARHARRCRCVRPGRRAAVLHEPELRPPRRPTPPPPRRPPIRVAADRVRRRRQRPRPRRTSRTSSSRSPERISPSVVAISATEADFNYEAAARADELNPDRLASMLASADRTVGTGFIVDADGYILTNDHVVAHAAQLWVTTDDRKVYPAMVVGSDPRADLAVLKIPANEPAAGALGRPGPAPPRAVVDRDRQPVRPGRRGRDVHQRRRRQRDRPLAAEALRQGRPPLLRPDPDDRPDQPRQLRRAAVRHPRRRDRHQHRRHPPAEADQRHRLRHPGQRAASCGSSSASRPARRSSTATSASRPARRPPASAATAEIDDEVGAYVETVETDSPAAARGPEARRHRRSASTARPSATATTSSASSARPRSTDAGRAGGGRPRPASGTTLTLKLRRREIAAAAVTQERQQLRWRGLLLGAIPANWNFPGTGPPRRAAWSSSASAPTARSPRTASTQGAVITAIAGKPVAGITELQSLLNELPADEVRAPVRPAGRLGRRLDRAVGRPRSRTAYRKRRRTSRSASLALLARIATAKARRREDTAAKQLTLHCVAVPSRLRAFAVVFQSLRTC